MVMLLEVFIGYSNAWVKARNNEMKESVKINIANQQRRKQSKQNVERYKNYYNKPDELCFMCEDIRDEVINNQKEY